MRDLPRRTATAAVYGVVVVAAMFAPPVVFAAFLVVVGALGLRELVALRRAGLPALAELILLVAGLGALFTLRVAGAVAVRGVEIPAWLVLAIVPTWIADIVAYLVGSLVGRHKIVPRISPGKSWEGTVAGFAAAALAVLALASLYGPTFTGVAPIVAILIGPVGLAGDLLKSWVKRRVGVKDSGTLLPGHGGVLDRVDSMLAAAVAVALVRVLQ